jgi:hypothetical protein
VCDDHWQDIQAEMEKTYKNTRSWVDWTLPSGANLVAFSSGWGDGFQVVTLERP